MRKYIFIILMIISYYGYSQNIQATKVTTGTLSITGASTSANTQTYVISSNGNEVTNVLTSALSDKYQTTSSSSITVPIIGNSVTFTIATGLAYTANQSVIVTPPADIADNFVGTVTSYNINTGSITIKCTSTNASGEQYSSWVVNLAGAVGAVGAQGPTGATGGNGIVNSTPFDTYASSRSTGTAVKVLGINGSNVVILANPLTGPTGATGPTGNTGVTGTNGTNGSVGATGATGPTGITGTNGTNGSTGATGPTGATGVTGTNGTNGNVGATGPTGGTGATGLLTTGSTNSIPYYNGSSWNTTSSGLQYNGTSTTMNGSLTMTLTGSSTTTSTPLAINVSGLTLNSTSGTQIYSQISPTISQSGSAGFTSFQVNATVTSTGSGNSNIEVWSVNGTAVGGVDTKGEGNFYVVHGVGSSDSTTSYTFTGTQNVYYKIANSTFVQRENDYVTMAGDSATILESGDYEVHIWIGASTGNSADQLRVQMYTNSIKSSISLGRFIVNSPQGAGIYATEYYMWYKFFNKNDRISFYIANISANRTITVADCKIYVRKLHN